MEKPLEEYFNEAVEVLADRHCTALKDLLTMQPKADIPTMGDFYNAASICQIEHLARDFLKTNYHDDYDFFKDKVV